MIETSDAPPPFRISMRARACSTLPLEEMKQEIAELNDQHLELGCALFPADDDDDNVVVIFAGAGGEMFNGLSLALGLPCEVIYFQDGYSAWYQGSSILPPIAQIAQDFLRHRIGERRAVFFGQSSGGYASLVAARYFPNSATLACSPQTFPDLHAKDRLHLIGPINLCRTLDGLVDIVAHWSDAPSDSRYVGVFVAASEYGNPIDSFYWLDHLHAMRLQVLDRFHIYLLAWNQHSMTLGRAKHFSSLLEKARRTPTSEMHALATRRLLEMVAASPSAKDDRRPQTSPEIPADVLAPSAEL